MLFSEFDISNYRVHANRRSAYTTDGQHLILAGKDKKSLEYLNSEGELVTQKCFTNLLASLTDTSEITSPILTDLAVVTSNGLQCFVLGINQCLLLLVSQSGELLHQLGKTNNPIRSITHSPQGDYLVVLTKDQILGLNLDGTTRFDLFAPELVKGNPYAEKPQQRFILGEAIIANDGSRIVIPVGTHYLTGSQHCRNEYATEKYYGGILQLNGNGEALSPHWGETPRHVCFIPESNNIVVCDYEQINLDTGEKTVQDHLCHFLSGGTEMRLLWDTEHGHLVKGENLIGLLPLCTYSTNERADELVVINDQLVALVYEDYEWRLFSPKPNMRLISRLGPCSYYERMRSKRMHGGTSYFFPVINRSEDCDDLNVSTLAETEALEGVALSLGHKLLSVAYIDESAVTYFSSEGIIVDRVEYEDDIVDVFISKEGDSLVVITHIDEDHGTLFAISVYALKELKTPVASTRLMGYECVSGPVTPVESDHGQIALQVENEVNAYLVMWNWKRDLL